GVNVEKGEGKNSEADPGNHDGANGAPVVKSGEPQPGNVIKNDAKTGMPEGTIKKSIEEQETLLKSYVDQKIGSLEGKLQSIIEAVKKIGERPLAPKGV